MNREILVYLFLGFLESGKTKFIQETMEDERFDEGENTLVLCTEEGVEEYDVSRFKIKKYSVEYLTDEEKFTTDNLNEIVKRTKADRILLEYNGMWLLQTLFDAMPENWAINQIMTFADSKTILNFNNNLRQQTFDKINMTELVVFNRFQRGMDKMPYHKMVRAISRRPQIVYEYVDGIAEPDEIVDPLPFDINADTIVVNDKDFALWYRDICEEPKKYVGKAVKFKGIVACDKKLPKGTFVVGRHIMTCCEADIAYSGFICKNPNNVALKSKDWITLTAKISYGYSEVYREDGPILESLEIVSDNEPEQVVATFW